jgi:hypothetical protein
VFVYASRKRRLHRDRRQSFTMVMLFLAAAGFAGRSEPDRR